MPSDFLTRTRKKKGFGLSRQIKHPWVNNYAGKRSSHNCECFMIIAAIIVEREATFVLIMTSAEKLSPCSGSLSSDSQSPCLPAPLSKRYCGLPGTGSHPKMSLLLRLGQENSAYHG